MIISKNQRENSFEINSYHEIIYPDG